MNTPTESILVTGATGTHGGTGRKIVELLRQQALPVRAMVHRVDERCDALHKLGAEIVAADFFDFESLLQAMKGTKRAYFCYPVGAGIVEATVNFVAAAKRSGVDYLVNNSMPVAHPSSPSPLARAQWLSEQVLDWSGICCIHVRGGFFFENILLMAEESIVRDQVIENGFGSAPIVWAAAEDVARVSALVLERREPNENMALLVTGGELLSFPQIAERFSAALGRPVEYVDTGDDYEAWKTKMVENLRIPPAMRDHLVGIAKMVKSIKEPRRPEDTVTRLTGSRAISFDAFLNIHRERLAARLAERRAFRAVTG